MVHLFLNCDEYLASVEMERLRGALNENPDVADLNYAEYEGDQVRAKDLLAEADTMPFLSERRMIRVNGYLTALNKRLKPRRRADVEAIAAGDVEGDLEAEVDDSPTGARAEAETILRGIADVAETCDLIFFDPLRMTDRGPANSVDLATSVLGKGLKADEAQNIKGAAGITALAAAKKVVLHTTSQPNDNALPQWIVTHAKQRPDKVIIEGPAASLLASWVGPDLRRLATEVEKLSLYAGKRPISVQEVRLLVADESEEKMWTLTDGLSARDGRKAMAAMATLLQEPNMAFAMLGSIAANYRMIIRTKSAMARGLNTPEAIAREIGANPYTVKKAMGVAGKFTDAQLANIVERIYRANVAMVTGGDQQTELEVLVADLTLAHSGN